MRVLVFLHGTAIMHPGAEDVTREERVCAVVGRHPSVYDFASYVPTPGAVARTIEWSRRGARIEYFSPHRRVDDIEAAEEVRPAG